MIRQAGKIWSLAIEEVLLAYHFLVNATGHFSFVWAKGADSPMTDGQRVYMDEEALIREFSGKVPISRLAAASVFPACESIRRNSL